MMIAELSRIDKSIEINAAPERVYRALSTAAELSAWFQVAIEGELAAGKDVWMTSVHPGHAGQRFNVRIVDMTPSRSVTWQWHPGEVDSAIDYDKEPRTTVRFTLEPTTRGTKLTVSETGFDAIALARRAKVHQDNTQGWTEVLVWLQKYVEASR
jgi:uncharacterized protein YndB with AHSA1/START domain